MPRDKERIQLTDTTFDVIHKLSDGNPGAVVVLCDWLKHHDRIDPYCHGMLSLLGLDTCGIHGPRVWMLYKDVCGCNLPLMVGCLRAWQLGIIDLASLDRAIDTGNRDGAIDLDRIKAAVKEHLEDFRFEYDPKAPEPQAATAE